MLEFEAVVTDIREESRVGRTVRWQLQLDATDFTEGDVGELRAVARSGAVLSVPVLSVAVSGSGEVWHVVEKPLGTGTEVVATVRREPVGESRG